MLAKLHCSARLTTLTVTVASCLVLILLQSADPAGAASTDKNGCSANLQTPHYSTGAGGVIAKANYSCTYVPSTVYLGTRTTGYWLWVCPSKGPDDESWIVQNCRFINGNIENVYATVSGGENIRYVPPAGNPPGHGSGWWISCSQWYSSGPKGVSSDRLDFSAWWEGSG